MLQLRHGAIFSRSAPWRRSLTDSKINVRAIYLRRRVGLRRMWRNKRARAKSAGTCATGDKMRLSQLISISSRGAAVRPQGLASAALACGLLAPSLAQGLDAPIRVSLSAPFPALVEQLGPTASRPASSELFPLDDAPAAVVLTGPREFFPAGGSFDIAEALLSDDQRMTASAMATWVKAPLAGPNAPERRRLRAAIASIYAARAYAPFWRESGPDSSWLPAAVSVAQRLRDAAADGLDLRHYSLPAVGQGPANIADELALSEAVAAYAAQASGSRVDPGQISRLIGARPALPEPGAVLAAVAAAGEQAGDILQAYNPPHYGYQLLRAKLAELRGERASDDLPAARVALAGSGRTEEEPSARKGKRRSGARTRTSSAHLEAEVIANMERWRWLPRDLGDSRIEVNIPDFELAVIRDGEVTHRARIIVGKETTPTPVFSNAMQFIIVNPYWNVPPSILNKEMLPQSGGDIAALQQRGFQVSYRRGKLSVRQPPGERNALGRIKFMFPNDYSVYLHDTPSRNLFNASHRAFSHGCMRVDQPFALAEAVLGPAWPEQRVRRLIGGSERYINLSKPLPIHIEYFTAYVDEDGQLQLRGDLYGYSARVRNALGLNG